MKTLARSAIVAVVALHAIAATSFAQSTHPLIGVWSGTLSSPEPGAPAVNNTLRVQSIGQQGETVGSVSWEAAPNWHIEKGGFNFQRGKLESNKLTIGDWNKHPVVLTFELRPDGTVYGERWQDKQLTTRGSMVRIETK